MKIGPVHSEITGLQGDF